MGKRLYLVTGGAGFIGSHICERLLKDGHSVRVLDNFFSGKEANLESIGGDVELIRGDITRCANGCRSDERRRDSLSRSGARLRASFGCRPDDDARSQHNRHAQRIACSARCRRATRGQCVKLISLWRHRGIAQTRRHDGAALSPYALSKLAGEHYISIFNRVYGFEAVALRYFNIFGPRQDPESQYAAVIPRFVTALMEGRQPVIYGDGLQSRDFTYVENVVEANLLASEAEGACGQSLQCRVRRSLFAARPARQNQRDTRQRY